MNRQEKIKFLKQAMAGNIKLLQDKVFVWGEDKNHAGNVFQCRTQPYTHLKLSGQQITAFAEKYGGQHIKVIYDHKC